MKIPDIFKFLWCALNLNPSSIHTARHFPNRVLKNKRPSGKARGDATSAAYSSICEHWREPRNAEWRPKAQFFNSLLMTGVRLPSASVFTTIAFHKTIHGLPSSPECNACLVLASRFSSIHFMKYPGCWFLIRIRNNATIGFQGSITL